MDFKQLEAFTKTVELNSFSKAAESVFLSQPSISLYINSLEKELGAKLIIRSTKDIKVTDNGKLFYEYAKNILSLKEKAIHSINDKINNNHAEIEILSSSVPAQYILPDFIIKFSKIYPNISFKIIQSDSKNVINEIISQRCELGIVGAKIENKKCFYRKLISEKLILIAPVRKKYKNIKDSSISAFLREENFIVREEGSATRIFYEKFLYELGLDIKNLKIIATFTNTQSIIHSVSKGLGIAIVSEIAAQEYIKLNQIINLDFDISFPSRDFYFIYKNANFLLPHTNLFLDFVYKTLNP